LKPLEDSDRFMIDSMPVMAWRCRPDGLVEFFNRRWLEYTGLSLDKAPEWGWTGAIHPDDLNQFTDNWHALLASGESGQMEARLRRGSGEYRWFLIQMSPSHDDKGDVVKWYGTSTDIDELKRTESLRASKQVIDEIGGSEAELRRVIDTIPAFVSCFLPDGANEFMNQRWHDYTGLSPEKSQRGGWQEPVHPDDLAKLMNRWRAARVSGEPEEIETRLRRHDGVFRWFLVRAEPLRDESGKVVKWYATSTDIEDRKQAEVKLRQDERDLRRIIDTIPALAWCSLPDSSSEFLNKRWHDFTGLSPEESRGWGWQAAIHPQDLAQVMDKWRDMLASGKAGELEARLQRQDGSFRWFLFRGEPLRDETGAIVRWYGTCTDIEDRKQAEEKLRQDERELRRITDVIAQLIVVHDPEGTPIYANQAVLDYTGLTIDDVICPDFRSRIIHPEDFDRLRDIRQTALLRGLPFEIEYRARRKDGEYRWLLNHYKPFRDEQGRLTRWYSTATDIDDRKRAENRTRNENVALREEIDHALLFEEIVGSSDAIRRVLGQVAKVAPTDSTVLIFGETGTGKELIARAIHKRSNRSARAFIRVNCGAIAPSLIASELFGHEKGAFTGAFQRRIGHFEAADSGTIFLDEIGDLPLDTQSSLLRVLQERELQRVGSSKPIEVDVRVLAATNRDLRSDVDAGRFREDLFYRFNVFPIRLPPLRERTDDIPLLVEYLVGRYAEKAGKRFENITSKTLELLQAYHWPGNIRELQNIIERAVILCDGATFSVDESWLRPESGPAVRLVPTLEDSERAMIEAALSKSKGRISGPAGAASELGIPRQTLDRKISGLGIDKNRFKIR
jgi:formate hydrogenlyase transcriptional activator